MLLIKCILNMQRYTYIPSKTSETFFVLSHTQEGLEAGREEKRKAFLEEYHYR